MSAGPPACGQRARVRASRDTPAPAGASSANSSPPRPQTQRSHEAFSELDGADLLCRTDQVRAKTFVELDTQLAPGQAHSNWARAPAVRNGRRSGGDGTRSGRQRLPRPALPHADGQLVLAVDADELDIRAFRKPRISLHARPEPPQLPALRLAPNHGVRIAHGNGGEIDALCAEVERLFGADLDVADVKHDIGPVHFCLRGPPRNADGYAVFAAASRKPCGDDACSVSRKLGRRSVGIPDAHVRARGVDRRDLEQT